MNIPELEKKIAILDDEVDAILSAFEKEWWSSGFAEGHGLHHLV